MDAKLTRKVLLLLMAAIILSAGVLFARPVLSYPNVSLKDHALIGIWKAAYFIEPSSRDLKHISKLHIKPESLTQSQCIACHGYMQESRKMSENSTVGSNVHFHIFITNANYSCVTCHRSGGVYSIPGKDSKGVYLGRLRYKQDEYSDAELKPGSFLRTKPSLCLDCHNGKNNTKTASSLAWPKPHTENGWFARHGMVSRRDNKICEKCHDEESFCVRCHNEIPQSHDVNWRPDHRLVYKARPEYCKTCHTADFCNGRCHGGQHTANWRYDHTETVSEKGNRFCINCHFTNYCVECHDNINPFKLYREESVDQSTQADSDEELQKKQKLLNRTEKINATLEWSKPYPYPYDIDVDKNGDIYVTDTFNNRIKKLNSEGKPIFKWGRKNDNTGELHNPSAISIDKNGDIVVTDIVFVFYDEVQYAQIQKFTPNGKVIDKLKRLEESNHSETYLSDSAIDSEGNKYISDPENYCVKKYSPAGKLIATWGSKTNYQFDNPHGVLVGEDGFIYILDWKGQFIQKYSKDGKLIGKLSGVDKGDYGFRDIRSIAVDKYGNIYVADTADNHIRKFDKNFRLVAKWGDGVLADGEFDRPRASAIDNEGNVYVADSGNNRIQKFDPDGKFLAKWGTKGMDDNQFEYLTGIDIDKKGNVYVVDSGNSKIQKFDEHGKLISSWKMFDDSNFPAFGFQNSIVVDDSGYILVSDADSRCVDKFSTSGKLLESWGVDKDYYSQFDIPQGIAIDAKGNILISEVGGNRIQILTPDGKLKSLWGKKGKGINQFNKPCGIAIDGNGNIYVADTGNNRIQKYRLP
jgi:DNA-binding beta-propeller fold protein YncE